MGTPKVAVLPIEVQERILEHLTSLKPASHSENHFPLPIYDKTSLAACALTRRAWVPTCRRLFYHSISISSGRQLLQVVSSTSNYIASYINHITASDFFPDMRFCHLVAHFFALKLPFLQRLVLRMDSKLHAREEPSSPPDIFVFHQSLPMNLAHLKNIQELRLMDLRFTSFTELRRLVGSLSGLVNLHLERVTWGSVGTAFPKALHRTTCWNISEVTMWSCPSNVLAIWFWVGPLPQKSLHLRNRPGPSTGLGNHSHPVFTPSCAYTLGELLKAISSSYGTRVEGSIRMTWLYLADQKCWNLNYHLRFYDQNPDVRLTVPIPDQPTSQGILTTANNQAFLSHIRSVEVHVTPWGDLLFTVDWVYIDHLLSQLDDLETVELHTKLIEREDELLKSAQGRYITHHLPLTRIRKGCSLRVFVNREQIPYDRLHRDDHLPDSEDARGRVARWPKRLADWFLAQGLSSINANGTFPA